MPNFEDFFGELGGRGNGGNARALGVLAGTPLPWVWTPELLFTARLVATELALATLGLQQTTLLTVSPTNFDTGRAVMTFSGGPLGATVVTVRAEAAAGDANTDLATAICDAVEAETQLDDYVSASPSSNVAFLTFVAGIGIIDVTVDYEEAVQVEVQFVAPLIDGDYVTTISGGGLSADVSINTNISESVPGSVGAMAIQHEADIEGLIATTLADVLQSADDDGVDLCTLVFEPGLPAVTVTTLAARQVSQVTVGGTASDGRYRFRVNHPDLPGGSQIVLFDRGGGETNTQIGDGLANYANALGALMAVYFLVPNAAGVLSFSTHLGVSHDTTIDILEEPGTGTLPPDDDTGPGMTASVVAVPAVTITPANFLTIDLGVVGVKPFPTHADRGDCAIERIASFGAGRTMYVGDTGDADAILGNTAISTTGRVPAAASVAEYQPRYEAAYVPLATLELGATAALTAGEVEVQIAWSPSPGPEA